MQFGASMSGRRGKSDVTQACAYTAAQTFLEPQLLVTSAVSATAKDLRLCRSLSSDPAPKDAWAQGLCRAEFGRLIQLIHLLVTSRVLEVHRQSAAMVRVTQSTMDMHTSPHETLFLSVVLSSRPCVLRFSAEW